MDLKITACLAIVALLAAAPVAAQQTGFQDELLDRFVGDWVLQGMIAGGEVTHDIEAAWVLGHQYLRFHDVARERDATGAIAYDATVFIGWDEPAGGYACLWLDSTGGGGLVADIIGRAQPNGDELAFLFPMGEGSVFHTTFAYDREQDTWEWRMDSERDGEFKPFARATMAKP